MTIESYQCFHYWSVHKVCHALGGLVSCDRKLSSYTYNIGLLRFCMTEKGSENGHFRVTYMHFKEIFNASENRFCVTFVNEIRSRKLQR